MTRRRRILLAGAALTIAIVAWLVVTVIPKIPVAAGYVALRVASGLAVEGRDLRAELIEDDALIGRFSIRIDQAAGAVETDLWGWSPRRARIMPGYGAYLELDGPAAERPDPWAGLEPEPQAWPRAELDAARRAAVEAVLAAAFAEPDEGQRRTRAVVVIQDGRLVAERYADGFAADSRFLGWSMAKSVANLLVGRLVAQGRMSLTEATGLWPADDPRAAITVEHLLGMTSGLDFSERAALSDLTRMLFASDDVATFAEVLEPTADPGTVFDYSSADTVLLSAVMRERLADDETYWRYPYAELFAPLGMTSGLIEADAAGTWQLSSFAYATARDWCRLGQLMLQDGEWRGQRLLPDGWVARSLTPNPLSEAGEAYGLGWWLNCAVPGKGDEQWLDHLPPDAYAARGHHQQVVMVVPSARLVVARFGLSRPSDAWDQEALILGLLAALSAPPP